MTGELAATGATAVAADLSTPDGPADLVRTAVADHGDLDLLVNNVGGGDAQDLRGFFDYDDELWQRSFDLNFFSAVRACRAAVDSVTRTRGLIVNISSISARVPGSGPAPYSTAKAALTAYGNALAEECAERGVRVVTVSPGPTRTPMWTDPAGVGGAYAAARGVAHADLLAGLAAANGIRSGRLVEPEEVAALVAFLASPHAPSITARDYVIDGGAVKTA